MKKWFLIILFFPTMVFSQPYSNDWIDFNKEYFKISVAEDGIYKVSYDDLNNAGFPVSVDPRRYQLFHRGVEVAINVEGQSDATFDPSDYLEFYGQKNDGTLDEALYINTTDQPHKYYNLYSDSSAYYLTYDQFSVSNKRMTSLTPFVGPVKDDYYNREALQVFTDQYSKGYTVSSYSNLTQFDVGEGFTGTRFTEVSNPIYDISFSNLDFTVQTAPNPELELLLVGRNLTNHTVEVFAGPDVPGLVSLGTYSFNHYDNFKITNNLTWSLIGGGGDLLMRVVAITDGGDQSNVSVSYAKFVYARQTDASSSTFREFDLNVKGSGGNVVELLNTAANSKVYDITDEQNVAQVIPTDETANTITCGFADGTQPRKLAISVTNTAFSVKKVNFRSIDALQANYIVISNKVLMAPATGTTDAVGTYAGYRASVDGGSFDTLVVDIDQLYNQFSYGEVSPLAIYNFMAYMINQGSPEYLLIIGKALDVSYKYHRQDPALFTYHDLVPTAGSPGADLPYTANLNGAGYEGAIPVGRLSVSTPQEIINYLNKVIEMEGTPYDALWRKNFLHLSGGNSAQELDRFKSYVDGFKGIAEDVFMGGAVTTVSKTNTAPVEFINVSEEVNKGLNLITFFGHSAPNVTDIDIGFVSDPANGYNNSGKYPMIVMNGCNAGNIYGDSYIFGEDWIATADLGATAVIAHTSYGFPFSLKTWSDNFYNVAYSDSVFIEKPVGNIQVEVGKRVMDFVGPNPSYLYITQVQQMGLQGDPAVKVFGSYVPDYEINNNNIQAVGLTEKGVTAEADSFAIALVVRNFGAYITDSLEVSIRRTLQDGRIIGYDTITYAPVRYLDTLVYTIDNEITGNSGNNTFEIVLDPSSKIDEHDEFNNLVYYNLFVPQSGTINISPLNFSIQSTQSLELITQSGNPLSEQRGYQFEIDSTYLFTSPFMLSNSITSKHLAKWENVSLLTNDSLAYYWRTKYEQPNPNESDKWSNSTFTMINGGSEGWAQVAYHQMINNRLTGLETNEGARSIDFLQTKLAIEITVHGANSIDYTYQDTEFIIDGLPYIFPGSFTLCADNKLQIVAFDQENAAPYAPIIGNQVEGWTCGRSPQVINSYPRGKTLDEIIDAIPSGDKVLLFTTGDFDFNTLSAATLAKLEDLGADGAILGAKLPPEPYIMLGVKGSGSGNSLVEIIADPALATPTDQQSISYSGDVVGVYASGVIESSDIGPALAWDKLSFNMKSLDASDVYAIDIIGKQFDGTQTLLYNDIQTKELPLTSIEADQYPYLKLKLKVEDDVTKTAPQIDKWIVNYEPPADGIIIYIDNDRGGGLSVTLQEGESFVTNLGFVNISNKNFTDSLNVDYTIFNQDRRPPITQNMNIAAPLPGDTTLIDIEINTKGMVGVNNLDVAVNTLVIAEQIYDNNNLSLESYFTVIKDASNPLLDVSFDGEYIFDGDIVSPNPNIHIIIRDDNKYIQKTDTTGIDIFIKKPCEGCSTERISLSSSEISWVPQSESEPFAIDYTPRNLEDGIYELSVQVEDASGNKSGLEPYVIHFEVINKSTVTNFYPYPNPFSTSVKFIFTLTGNEIPDEILIRIFTVSGRVVREITQDELGPLKIGNNATDYAWDGHDEFGDQLANGVYLYKVYIRKDGQQIELRNSGGDGGFKNGYGKMYLLR